MSIVGFVAGIITIISYFFSDADSLLEGLGELLPPLAEFFGRLEDAVVQFAESWPLGPWLSAFVIFLVIILLRYLTEIVFDLITVDVTVSGVLVQMLIFLPLALLWIWIFSGVITSLGLLIFIIGYIVSIILSIFLASEFGLW